MSDFVVWMSPIAIPDSIRRRWIWSKEGRLGVRRSTFTALGRAHDEDRSLATIGQPGGSRGNRRWEAPDTRARHLLHELPSQGSKILDQYLGPVAGACLSQGGDHAIIWRDRFGRHPIQMVRLSQGWVVTTSPELSGFLSAGRPNWANIAAFIHGDHDRSDGDSFTDIYRLRPGELVHFRGDQLITRKRWWTPRQATTDRPHAEVVSLLHVLGEFYGRRPHCLALSAGLDSSTLAAFATSYHPRNEAVTFSDPQSIWDETSDAAETARHLNLRWSPFSVHELWPLSRIEDHRAPPAWGPAAHPDAAWKQPFHRWLHARRGPLPVIYGNGADEILWFPSSMWLRDRWHQADLTSLARAFPHLSLSQWLRPALSLTVDRSGLARFRDHLPSPEPDAPPWQRSRDWIHAGGDAPPLLDVASPFERFTQLRTRRLQTWHWERIMRSLATESRRARRSIWTPFLDAEFWELSLALSPNHLVEGGRQKSILRRAVGDLLPDACRLRPKVGGFDPLVERGLAQQGSRTIYALFAQHRLTRWRAFDHGAFMNAFDAYRRSPPAPNHRLYRGSWELWRTLATELWLRELDHQRPRHQGGLI